MAGESLLRSTVETALTLQRAGYPGDPFADTNKVHGLDGNPFDDDAAVRQATTLPHAYPYASEGDGYEEATPTKSSGRRADDTAARLEEIRRREIELEQRERTLGQREEHIRNYGKNNWPPL